MTIAGFEFEASGPEEGYAAVYRGEVNLPSVQGWGKERDPDVPTDVEIYVLGDGPSPQQVTALEWLIANDAAMPPRLQGATEQSWRDCYAVMHGEPADAPVREPEDTEEYSVETVTIYPTPEPSEEDLAAYEELDDVLKSHLPPPRDPSLPALLVIELAQDWEEEHGYYLFIDPVGEAGDSWGTWDSLNDRGYIRDDDDEAEGADWTDDEDDDVDAAIASLAAMGVNPAAIDAMKAMASGDAAAMNVARDGFLNSLTGSAPDDPDAHQRHLLADAAIQEGDADKLAELLGAMLEADDDISKAVAGFTLLNRAVAQLDVEAFEFLLNVGADPTVPGILTPFDGVGVVQNGFKKPGATPADQIQATRLVLDGRDLTEVMGEDRITRNAASTYAVQVDYRVNNQLGRDEAENRLDLIEGLLM